MRSPVDSDLDSFRVFLDKIGKETIFTGQTGNSSKKSDENILGYWKNIRNAEIGFQIMVFLDSGKMIGAFGLSQYKASNPCYKHIVSFGMMVLKEFWGEGLGSKLLKEGLDYCEENNIKRLEAEVRAENVRAMSLYLKNGFEIEGILKKRACINGKMIDDNIIAKFFDIKK